eukprot:14072924-Alexandrium_andersonii.AAC.1
MKAQGAQRRTAFGTRGSSGDDWHCQSGASHGPALRVSEAQGRLGWHGGEEHGRAWDGKVGPEATLRLRQ